MQHRLPREIAEADMVHLHLPRHPGKHLGAGGVGGLLRLIQQREDPLRRRQGRIEFVEDIGHLVDGAAEFPRVEDE